MAEAGSLTEPAFAVPGGPLPDGVQLWLVRHGETTWSESGRHTGRTDLPLTAAGEAQAVALREVLSDVRPAFVLCSPRQRAVVTAQLAGLRVDAIDEDLAEWDYGDYEGLTSVQIRETRPDWYLFRDGCPNGETAEQVGERVDRVISEVREVDGDAAVFGHGHCLRVLAARWLGLAAEDGGRLALSTATVGVLGYEHDRPALWLWNERSS
jgi:probable phosphoglycerate mutase